MNNSIVDTVKIYESQTRYGKYVIILSTLKDIPNRKDQFFSEYYLLYSIDEKETKLVSCSYDYSETIFNFWNLLNEYKIDEKEKQYFIIKNEAQFEAENIHRKITNEHYSNYPFDKLIFNEINFVSVIFLIDKFKTEFEEIIKNTKNSKLKEFINSVIRIKTSNQKTE